ncbi:Cell wall binding repeat 2-containing protein, partial [Desulfitobacterium hafniense]
MKKKKLVFTGVFTTAYVVNLMLSPISAYAGTLDAVKVTNGAQERAAIHTQPIVSPESILRLGGIDRFETAAKIAQAGWSEPSANSENQTIAAILTSGMDENLVDALSAAPLATKLNAPLLLTESNRLNPFTESELKRLKVNTVYITTGTGVISQPVIDALKKINSEMKIFFLGGKDRFETSVNIAKEMGKFDEVVIATGESNADALSMASIAAAKGNPILLSDAERLPDAIVQYLEDNKSNIKKYYLLGGEGSLSSKVQSVLSGKTVRIAGLDRYETNQKILATFASEINDDKVYLANGDDSHLVDALTGAVLAAKTNSPVLLVGSDLNELTKDFVKLGLSPLRNVVALGGNAVVEPTLVNDMVSATVYEEDKVKVGSENTDSPQVINDNVYVMGNSVTMENAEFKYNLYVHGNNASLKNVKVAGSIFVNPGENGTLKLDNVQAKNVYVLSGAAESIHLVNSKIINLIVDSSSNVRIVNSGTTDVTNTVVSSMAILESVEGSFGTVKIGKSDDSQTVVELRGTFDKPVTVTDAAKVIAAPNANISELVVAPQNKEDIVTLQGKFKTVAVNNQALLELGHNTSVSTIEINASVNLILDATARIIEITENGNTVTVSGNGAHNIGYTGNTNSDDYADNPGDGGDADNPGDGGDADNPGDGGDADNPGDGGDADNPGDGGDADNPG